MYVDAYGYVRYRYVHTVVWSYSGDYQCIWNCGVIKYVHISVQINSSHIVVKNQRLCLLHLLVTWHLCSFYLLLNTFSTPTWMGGCVRMWLSAKQRAKVGSEVTSCLTHAVTISSSSFFFFFFLVFLGFWGFSLPSNFSLLDIIIIRLKVSSSSSSSFLPVFSWCPVSYTHLTLPTTPYV